jgi:hypothetical protein
MALARAPFPGAAFGLNKDGGAIGLGEGDAADASIERFTGARAFGTAARGASCGATPGNTADAVQAAQPEGATDLWATQNHHRTGDWVLKEQRGMPQFLRRGLAAVHCEWLLAAISYNVTRCHRRLA